MNSAQIAILFNIIAGLLAMIEWVIPQRFFLSVNDLLRLAALWPSSEIRKANPVRFLGVSVFFGAIALPTLFVIQLSSPLSELLSTFLANILDLKKPMATILTGIGFGSVLLLAPILGGAFTLSLNWGWLTRKNSFYSAIVRRWPEVFLSFENLGIAAAGSLIIGLFVIDRFRASFDSISWELFVWTFALFTASSLVISAAIISIISTLAVIGRFAALLPRGVMGFVAISLFLIGNVILFRIS